MKIPKFIFAAIFALSLASCRPTPEELAKEYNEIVAQLEQTTDSVQRDELFKKQTEIHRKAREIYSPDDLKAFLEAIDSKDKK